MPSKTPSLLSPEQRVQLRKLAAYPRQNQIARALAEIGQIEKTVFIL